MKPFLLLATRENDRVAAEEYKLFCKFSGLKANELIRIRLEQDSITGLNINEYSGIFLGGGPYNASDPMAKKSAAQLRVEAELKALLDQIVAQDYPFLGACYGIGTLGSHQGGKVAREYPEPISIVPITLNEAGKEDPLLAGLPENFWAFVGHKEALSTLPKSAVNLASSPACPIQMFRVGENVYATQFHPELDADGITTRIHVYANEGYFGADELELTLEAVRKEQVSYPKLVLQNFVERYRQS